MARMYANSTLPKSKKTTRQGNGTFTKKTSSGGEAFHNGRRSGSPPGKFHRKRKPRRGQGK